MKYTKDLFDLTNSLEGTWAQKAQILTEDYGFPCNKESLRKLATRFEEKNEICEFADFSKLNEVFKDEKPEIIKNNGKEYYVFHVSQTDAESGTKYDMPISVAVETVDRICFDFSTYGANLTQKQILNKYRLNGKSWMVLKNRLNLTKLSDAVSEQTLENADREGNLEALVEETIDKSLAFKSKALFEKVSTAKKEARFKLLETKFAQGNWFIDQLVEKLSGKVKPLPKLQCIIPSNKNKQVVFLSDMHFGRKGYKETLEYFSKIKSDIIHSSAGEIIVVSLGDLHETFAQDGMHSGQIANNTTEEFGRGHDAVLRLTNIFTTFLYDIRKFKKVKFLGITGNHDRSTRMKEDDKQRMAGLAVYEMIKLKLAQTDISVSYTRETVDIFDIENIRFIMGHGDGRAFDKQNPLELIIKHGDLSKYNIILSGDKHNFQMKDVSKGLFVKAPALCVAGDYEKSQDYDSQPGYIVVSPRGDKAEINVIKF